MPSQTKIPKKSVKKTHVRRAENGARLKTLTRKQKKRIVKKQQLQKELPSAWKILRLSLSQLWQNKKVFMLILLVYALLYVLFVRGLSSGFELGSLKTSFKDAFGGKLGTFGTGVALYGLLLGSVSSTQADTSGTYQTILIIIMSLALIWALRQTYQKQPKIRMRDSFYLGMYALVPFVLVSLFIVIQLIPAIITDSMYSVANGSGILVGSTEKAIGVIILLAGMALSAYWISCSLFALYIVTLPGTGPVAALKSAKKLVRYRRLKVIRKALFLPLVLVAVSAVVLIPLIIFLAPAAEIVFMLFTIMVLAIFHAYFYTLYRSLLNE